MHLGSAEYFSQNTKPIISTNHQIQKKWQLISLHEVIYSWIAIQTQQVRFTVTYLRISRWMIKRICIQGTVVISFQLYTWFPNQISTISYRQTLTHLIYPHCFVIGILYMIPRDDPTIFHLDSWALLHIATMLYFYEKRSIIRGHQN